MASEPRRLGDFEIVREIGRGGMGVVYEATQLSLNRKVALKVLPWGITTTHRDVSRFRREAEAAAKLHHTHIVPIFAQGEHQGTRHYAMRYTEGCSLNEVIADTQGVHFSSATIAKRPAASGSTGSGALLVSACSDHCSFDVKSPLGGFGQQGSRARRKPDVVSETLVSGRS